MHHVSRAELDAASDGTITHLALCQSCWRLLAATFGLGDSPEENFERLPEHLRPALIERLLQHDALPSAERLARRLSDVFLLARYLGRTTQRRAQQERTQGAFAQALATLAQAEAYAAHAHGRDPLYIRLERARILLALDRDNEAESGLEGLARLFVLAGDVDAQREALQLQAALRKKSGDQHGAARLEAEGTNRN